MLSFWPSRLSRICALLTLLLIGIAISTQALAATKKKPAKKPVAKTGPSAQSKAIDSKI
jgi:hypothetical protein